MMLSGRLTMKIQAALAPLALTLVTGLSLCGCDTAEQFQRHNECQKRLAEIRIANARVELAVEALGQARGKRDEKVAIANRLAALAERPGQSVSVRMEWSRARGEAEAAEAELNEATARSDREYAATKSLLDASEQFCGTAAGK